MRLNNKHELKNYLANKRVAYIQKAHIRTHTRVQLINNELIDEKIITWNNEIDQHIQDPFKEENILNSLIPVNKMATGKDLQRILKHSLITRNPETEASARRVITSTSQTISKIEAERIIKNLNYAEQVLNNAELDIKKYEALIEKLPQRVSRKEILDKCIIEGGSTPRQRFLETALKEGMNYKGKEYTYKELNQLSRDLERYKTNRLDYETAIMENQQANREGYEAINQTKTWIWSTLEKTRHSGLDGETIPINDLFTVVNEQNGDTDYLLFPGDVENDHNNCSNICNCGCSYEINNA